MLKSDLFIKAMNEELYRSKKMDYIFFSVFKHESKEETISVSNYSIRNLFSGCFIIKK